MRNASGAFKQMLAADERAYLNKAVITLTDHTVLALENDDIWENGLSMDDAVSADNVFEVGAAIINQGKVVINNIDESYSQYDFDGASVVLYVGLTVGNAPEWLQMGTFAVDETEYNGSVITLTCLDNMVKFDQPYTTTLVYPATLAEIVSDACSKCGVTQATNSLIFPNSTYEVDTKPSGESTTYRQVLSWCAQLAGRFARCNSNGELELKWYDVASLDNLADGLDGGSFDNGTPHYTSGDTADGGSFNPWNTGYVYDGGSFSTIRQFHIISSDYSANLATDDVVITGVKVIKKVTSDTSSESYEEYMEGTAGYVVSIEGNELIQGAHGQDIATFLGTALIGFRFRKASITHPSDPTIEAGDVALFYDRKGREYRIIVSSTNFTSGSSQLTTSSAETPRKNSTQRFTEATKNYVELRKQLQVQKSEWEAAEEELARRIANSSGLYPHNDAQLDGSVKIYYTDKPNLSDSEVVMVFTTAGFTMTPNYQSQTPTWYGMTVDGQFIASVINTIALFFDNAHGGTLTLGGNNNTNGKLRILNASGVEIGKWDKDGISASTGTFSGNLSAPGGNIAGFTLSNNSMYTGSHSTVDSGAAGVFVGTTGLSCASSATAKTAIKSGYIQITSDVVPTASNLRSDVGVYIHSSNDQYQACIGSKSILYVYDNGTDLLETILEVDRTGIYTDGEKNRVYKTKDYDKRLLYCYETSSPMFGDIGDGIIGENGSITVFIDPVFSETIDTASYQVFLQKYGNGDCYVSERKSNYFVVTGTPGMPFGWELKAKQADLTQRRLDVYKSVPLVDERNYGEEAMSHISEINTERGTAA